MSARTWFLLILCSLLPICYGITWETGPYDLPIPLRSAGFISYSDNFAYLFGGMTNLSDAHINGLSVNSIYKLDLTQSTPSWRLLSVQLPWTNFESNTICKVGDIIYLYKSGTFYLFDTETDTFADNTAIATNPWSGGSSVVVTDGANYIYLIGGYRSITNYTVRYDIGQNSYSLISSTAPLLTWYWLNPLYYNDGTNERIYIFGGYGDKGSGNIHFNDIYYFDLSTNSWSNSLNTLTLTGTMGKSVYITQINMIYIIERWWSVARKVNAYDPINNIVTTETSRGSDQSGCTSTTMVVLLQGRIQLFGGYRNGDLIQTANCRTELLNTPKSITSTPTTPTAVPTTPKSITSTPTEITTAPTTGIPTTPTAVPTKSPVKSGGVVDTPDPNGNGNGNGKVHHVFFVCLLLLYT